jgi:hypothetical protein
MSVGFNAQPGLRAAPCTSCRYTKPLWRGLSSAQLLHNRLSAGTRSVIFLFLTDHVCEILTMKETW